MAGGSLHVGDPALSVWEVDFQWYKESPLLKTSSTIVDDYDTFRVLSWRSTIPVVVDFMAIESNDLFRPVHRSNLRILE